jgi:RNA polymerase sigma-70 factor (ECF subfamily)
MRTGHSTGCGRDADAALAAPVAVVGPMTIPPHDPESCEDRVREGDRNALATLFAAQEGRLRRWVQMRLDSRLQGRLSPSDVVQEIYLAAEQRLEHFQTLPDMPFRVWIRLLADQRLVDVHRRHLGAQVRDAGKEVSLERSSPMSGAAHLGARLAGDLASPSQDAIRAETLDILMRAVEAMDPMDREVLAFRHFDELTNDEVAHVLGISKGTASKRYVRALARLRQVLERTPGLLDDSP